MMKIIFKGFEIIQTYYLKLKKHYLIYSTKNKKINMYLFKKNSKYNNLQETF